MALTKKNIGIIIKLVIFLAVVVLIYISYKRLRESVSNNLKSKINRALPIGEFSSLKYYYTSIQNYKDPMRLLLFKVPIPLPFDVGYKKIFYSVDGVVTLGFNSDDIKFNIDNINNKIVLKMPEIKILSHEIDLNTFKLFDVRSEWIFNEFKSTDFYYTRAELEKRIVEGINKDSRVYIEAKESAKEQLEIFIESFPNIKDKYIIEIKWD